MGRQRARPVSDEIERVRKIVALAEFPGSRSIAATVGMLAGPAIVGFGQSRRGGGQRFGGVGRCLGRSGVTLADRSLVGLGFLEERILLQLLLDEGGEFEMRKLKKLDRLLQLRRHRQRLARSQDETRSDTHVPPPQGP